MDLRVDDSAMKDLVTKALVDSLTPETREKLITESIKSLLTTPEGRGTNYYGEKVSPLQSAFNSAVRTEAERYAMRYLTEDATFQGQVQSLFADVAQRLFEADNREELVSSLADVIKKALTKDRY